MKFSIEDFFSKCDQICSFLRIWLNLLKKYLMENFIFCAGVWIVQKVFLFNVPILYPLKILENQKFAVGLKGCEMVAQARNGLTVLN